MNMNTRRVGIIGTGRIGRAWAIVFARAGYEVRLHDKDRAMLDGALPSIRETLLDLSGYGLIDEAPERVVERIRACPDLADAVSDVDLVQENIAEVVEIKRALFEELDRLTRPDTLLASSTSGLPASSFTESLNGRARCLVAHPVNPPSLVPLVELCGAPWTAPHVMEQARSIYADAGQKPVIVRREIPGFLLNRLQGAVLNEALSLHARGYASAEDIDTVMRDGLGLRWAFMGPFETIDLNAPGGVADYAARYGAMYRSFAKDSIPYDWSDASVAKLDAERREQLPRDQIEERSQWRDRRLMALLAHRRSEKE